MSKIHTMKKSAGFTLLELIAVILIVSILSVTAISRFANQSDYSLRTEQELVIAALFQAQQLAMSGRPTQFAILSDNTFTVRDATNAANHYDVAGITYPQELRGGVTFNSSSLVLTYNGLGATAPSVIGLEVGGDSAQIAVSGAGYARAQ